MCKHINNTSKTGIRNRIKCSSLGLLQGTLPVTNMVKINLSMVIIISMSNMDLSFYIHLNNHIDGTG